jgi:membrane-bound lytic murein transglycosylase MltF
LGVPTSPEATGASLAKVEVGLRGENRDPATLQELGREQQLAYVALSNHADWLAAVLTAVPATVRASVQANVDAANALNKLTGSAPAPTAFPDWQILAPPATDTLRSYYQEAAQATGISWAYLAALHFVESKTGRIHGNSPAGAQGPMQFLPSTFAAYGKGGNINDNHDAILAAARYLADAGGPANMDKALFAYNHDNGYVAAVKAYAQVMLADPKAYDGYYQWQVLFAMAGGTYLMPEGYGVKKT